MHCFKIQDFLGKRPLLLKFIGIKNVKKQNIDCTKSNGNLIPFIQDISISLYLPLHFFWLSMQIVQIFLQLFILLSEIFHILTI